MSSVQGSYQGPLQLYRGTGPYCPLSRTVHEGTPRFQKKHETFQHVIPHLNHLKNVEKGTRQSDGNYPEVGSIK